MAYNDNGYYYQGQTLMSNPFPYQFDQRPKTPVTSNGYSPAYSGPISTPPYSRNPSQPPEQQMPDQIMYEEAGSSLSNSPTSAQTPDDAPFEFDMLDQSSLGTLITPQTSQASNQAMDMGGIFFSDQVLDQVMQQTHQHWSAQFHTQPQQQHVNAMLPAQPYNQMYGQNYTQQAPRHDPWNVQAPPRNPNVPRTGDVIFDPVTDPNHYPVPYVEYGAPGWTIANWTQENTDPNYLISPDTPSRMPPMDTRFHIHTQGMTSFDNMMDTSPVESRTNSSPTDMRSNCSPVDFRVIEPSPSPDQNFVNYNPKSNFFTSQYITEDQFSPSPGTSVVGHANNSPYQAAASPQAPPSPLSSDVIPPYQHSESEMNLEIYQREDIDPRALHPRSPAMATLTHRRSIAQSSPSTVGADMSMDHELDVDGNVQQAARGPGGRSGGRQLGTHLHAEVAKAAHDMRKIVACWHCVLQRDKCGPGDICERCLKRSQRPNADCGLGCNRMKLVELIQYFLPTLSSEMHENNFLIHFADRHIAGWLQSEIVVKMTCGQKDMPRFDVKVYEFHPKDRSLLTSIQYRTDPRSFKRVREKKYSPALGMQQINHADEKKYDKYLNDIVENHLDNFATLCWLEDNNDFQERLFRLMLQLKPQRDDEKKLLKEVFRLIVCTFIMSHTLTLANETKFAHLRKMRSFTHESNYSSKFVSPRLANRQLKYFFHRLQRNILSAVLNKLQQIFKSSKGCDKWLAAFIAVVGMAMAHEDQQKTLHIVVETRASFASNDPRTSHGEQAAADLACQEIDARMMFISQIFRWKYNRRCNPMKDADLDWEGEAGFGDANSVHFVRQVSQLVKENIDFLQQRQNVSINHANQTQYTSRLVGRFLTSFWLPS